MCARCNNDRGHAIATPCNPYKTARDLRAEVDELTAYVNRLCRNNVHMRRQVLTAQAKAEGMLRLAARVLVDGDGVERADVARQITELLGEVAA